ncbi:MAG: carboxysome shell carbonic anhydrase [Nitrosomonas sp.]|nr:carboxysome shell carbonic anhydrase [Nitrosomonas sp.]
MPYLNHGIDYLLDLNVRHAQTFMDSATERRRYRGEHPTEIAALKCMDGRLNLPVMTQTTVGIIQPYRNLGGKFDLGWPFFQATINDWVQYAIKRGRHCVIFVTYHYSRGDLHRGCRGFNYDKAAACDTAVTLKAQFDRIYGGGGVVPIVCGIETDLEALVLHGNDGQVVDLAEVNLTSQQEIETLLRALYPVMHERVTFDLLPLIQGNIKYISMVRKSDKPIEELEHNEWVLGVGRGFDWLHAINTAFIVGPFDPHLSFAIETAAKLLEGNIEMARIDPNGIVLLTSSAFRDSAGPEHNLAKEKAVFLRKFSLDIIKQRAPKLVPYLQILTGCTNMNTRKFEVIERYNKVADIDG